MRVVLQRVTSASVEVEGTIISRIDHGLLALVGIEQGDTVTQAQWLADKTAGLRVFADAEKLMNRSVADVHGQVLAVSQFTLAADTSRGRRPGFSSAADPDQALPIYQHYVDHLQTYCPVATGRFGADMQIALVNDGPVTFLLERSAT